MPDARAKRIPAAGGVLGSTVTIGARGGVGGDADGVDDVDGRRPVPGAAAGVDAVLAKRHWRLDRRLRPCAAAAAAAAAKHQSSYSPPHQPASQPASHEWVR